MIYAGRFALQIFIVSYFFETALAQENKTDSNRAG